MNLITSSIIILKVLKSLRYVILFFLLNLISGCNDDYNELSNINNSSIINNTTNDVLDQFNNNKAVQDSVSDFTQLKVKELNEKGVALRNNSMIAEALKIHFQAYQLSIEVDDLQGRIFALNNIATDLRRVGSNIEATKYHHEALQLAEKDSAFVKSYAIASNGLGNIYLSINKPNESIKYFEQSLAIEEKLHSGLGRAINYANLGEAYRLKGSLNKAHEYYDFSIKENKLLKNSLGEAICLASIGKIFLDKRDLNQAIFYVNRALLKIQGINDLYHRIQIEFILCEVYISQNKINKALKLIRKILKEAKQINSFIFLKRAYSMLVEINKHRGAYKLALEAKEMEFILNDSINKNNNEVKVIEIEQLYKNKEALQKINYLTTQNRLTKKSKKDQFLILGLITLLLLVLVVFLYYSYRKRKIVNQELRSLSEMKSKFFNNISHEFKTPLTLIKGPIGQLLQKRTISIEEREILSLIDKNTDTLLELVNKTLNLSKLEANTFEVFYQKGNLMEFLRQLSMNFNYLASDKNLKFNLQFEESGIVEFDNIIVKLMVNNLLSNAFKYTPIDGEINVSTNYFKNYYQFKVKNTVQKDIEDVDKLFNRYYTQEISVDKGTGIGLALVKELSQLYGSPIDVDYKPNQSITFTVNFPLRFSNTELINTRDTETSEPTDMKDFLLSNIKLDPNKPIVLIAEDSSDMRLYFKSIFHDHFNVIIVENGEIALNKCLELIPDVVVSDLMMPVMDGIELCNSLKTNPLTSHIPVMLLSAISEKDVILEALKIKADDYITKPFTSDILLYKVENLINIREVLKEKYKNDIVTLYHKDTFNNSDPFQNLLGKIVNEHLHDPEFDTELFCYHMHMSRSQLHRKLTAIFDMSATEFIRYHRLKKGAELLMSTSMNITEVCFACGFSSPAYFSKQFKFLFGKSPKEFKNS